MNFQYLLRFFGLREPHDYQAGPLHYCFLRLLILLFPWAPLVAVLMHSPRRGTPFMQSPGFARCGFSSHYCFFSVAGQGTIRYFVLTPPCALLLSLEVECRLRTEADKLLAYCLAISSAICAAALMIVPSPDLNRWTQWQGVIP
jgi:hypothetical protein